MRFYLEGKTLADLVELASKSDHDLCQVIYNITADIQILCDDIEKLKRDNAKLRQTVNIVSTLIH